MDAIEILGGLLSGRSSQSGGGLGGSILKDIINAGTRGGAAAGQPRQAPPSSERIPSGGHKPSNRPESLDERARELEDLRDLAHGLRLDAQFCNDLHQRYGAPTIF